MMLIARGNTHRSSVCLVFSLVVFLLILSFRSVMLFEPSCFAQNSTSDTKTEIKAQGETCFVTMQMAANGNFLEPLQNMSALGIRLDHFRYIVVTNDEALDAKDWEKVILNLDTRRFPFVKMHVTYAKFLAWTLPELASCSVVFVMDALNVPVNRADVWKTLEDRVNASPIGLLAQLKPRNVTNIENLLKLSSMKKETAENVQFTHQWLSSRPDFNNDTLCLWTNFFGYKTTSIDYRTASAEFWKLYSTTPNLTLRDQPLWSYVVGRSNLSPTYFQSKLERRPHVHICAERDRILCETIGRKCKEDTRNQHTLDGSIDPNAIDCNKTKGAHKMSVLNTFA